MFGLTTSLMNNMKQNNIVLCVILWLKFIILVMFKAFFEG